MTWYRDTLRDAASGGVTARDGSSTGWMRLGSGASAEPPPRLLANLCGLSWPIGVGGAQASSAPAARHHRRRAVAGPDGRAIAGPDGRAIAGPDGRAIAGPDGRAIAGPDGPP